MFIVIELIGGPLAGKQCYMDINTVPDTLMVSVEGGPVWVPYNFNRENNTAVYALD